MSNETKAPKVIAKAPAAPIVSLPQGYAYLKPADLKPHPLQVASKRGGMPERLTIESYLDRGQLTQYAPLVSKGKDGTYTILRGHLRTNLAVAATREELLTVSKIKDAELGLLAGLFANGLVCQVVSVDPMSPEGIRLYQDHDNADTVSQKPLTGGEMLRLLVAAEAAGQLESAIGACRRDGASKWRTIFGWISPKQALEWAEKAAANKEEVSQRALYLALQAVKAPLVEAEIAAKAAALVADGAEPEAASKTALRGKKSIEAKIKPPKDAAALIVAELEKPKAPAAEAVKWKAKAEEAAATPGMEAARMVYLFASQPTLGMAADIIALLRRLEKLENKPKK